MISSSTVFCTWLNLLTWMTAWTEASILQNIIFLCFKHMWSALTSTCWSLWILFKEFLCWCFESLSRVCQIKISSKRLVDGHLGGLNARVDIFEVGQQREITLHFLVRGWKHGCISCLVVKWTLLLYIEN